MSTLKIPGAICKSTFFGPSIKKFLILELKKKRKITWNLTKIAIKPKKVNLQFVPKKKKAFLFTRVHFVQECKRKKVFK